MIREAAVLSTCAAQIAQTSDSDWPSTRYTDVSRRRLTRCASGAMAAGRTRPIVAAKCSAEYMNRVTGSCGSTAPGCASGVEEPLGVAENLRRNHAIKRLHTMPLHSVLKEPRIM